MIYLMIFFAVILVCAAYYVGGFTPLPKRTLREKIIYGAVVVVIAVAAVAVSDFLKVATP